MTSSSYSVRRSRISAIQELAPHGEGPLHVGWQRLRAALRGAGVAPGLVARSFHARLGPHARVCPTRETVIELMDGYCLGEALGRPSEARYLSHRDGERDSARQIVARIRRALPELGMLTLADESRGGTSRLVLRARGVWAVVPTDEVEEEHFRVGQTDYVRRTVTVDGLVEATNQLLAMRDLPVRFLPLNAPDDVDAYLAVDPAAAEVLDRVCFWAAPLDELRGFARWPESDTACVA